MAWHSTLVIMVASMAYIELSLLPLQTIAKTVIVGGSMGWTNFDDSLLAAPDYTSWASSQSVEIGDLLVFKYKPVYHDVYLLPNRKAFEYCNFTDATVLDEGRSGSFTWIPSRQGVYYFACNRSIEGARTHCGAGQKVSINVSAKSDLQSPVIPPSPAPVMSPGVSPSYTPSPSFVSTPSRPSIPFAFPPYPQHTINSAPSLSPSFSPTLAPSPILPPTTVSAPNSPSLPLSIPSSPVPVSSRTPFISSTPYAPLSQIGANPGSAAPLPSLNEDKSAAVIWGTGLLCCVITSYAFVLLLVQNVYGCLC